MTEAETIASAVNEMLRQKAVDRDRIEALDKRNKELETALREKDNIAYIIDGHGITHNTFTIVYRAALAGEASDDAAT